MKRHGSWPILHIITVEIYSLLYGDTWSVMEGIMLNITTIFISFICTTDWKKLATTSSTYIKKKEEVATIDSAETSMEEEDHLETNQPTGGEELDIMKLIPAEILDGIFSPDECSNYSPSTQ